MDVSDGVFRAFRSLEMCVGMIIACETAFKKPTVDFLFLMRLGQQYSESTRACIRLSACAFLICL